MSAMNPAAASVDHRTRVLRALGVTPWALRAASPTPAGDGNEVGAVVDAAVHGDCVVLLPAGSDPRALDVLGRALQSCGAVVARAARLEVRDGELPGVPVAKAYLAFGEAQARALGRVLPAAMLQQAHIVLADEPAALVGSPAAKRRLWTALRSVRRALSGRAD